MAVDTVETTPKPQVSMLAQDAGKGSTMLVVMFYTILIITGVWAADNVLNIINCLRHAKDIAMVDFSTNAVMVLFSVIGGKVVQKFAEKPTNPS